MRLVLIRVRLLPFPSLALPYPGCFADDTRILTSAGFKFIDELQQMKNVEYACYDRASDSVVFRTGTLVYPPNTAGVLLSFTPHAERQRMDGGVDKADISPVDDCATSLRVTPDHRMFAQVGLSLGVDGKLVSPGVHLAADLARAPNCVCSGECSCQAAHTAMRMQAIASQGVKRTEAEAEQIREFIENALGISEQTQVDAFLQLYGQTIRQSDNQRRACIGVSALICILTVLCVLLMLLLFFSGFWLLAGSDVDGVGFVSRRAADSDWLRVLLSLVGITNADWAECTLPHGATEFTIHQPRWSAFFDSAHGATRDGEEGCGAWAAQLLDQRQIRLVVGGLQRASIDQQGLSTESVRLRDDLLHLLLLAGYTPTFRQSHAAGDLRGYTLAGTKDRASTIYTRDEIQGHEHEFCSVVATSPCWLVSYSGLDSSSSSGACYPPLLRGDVIEDPYTGPVWCVTVDHPDHLIVAQRAIRDETGCVVKAARPIIVGQCEFFTEYKSNGHSGLNLFFNWSQSFISSDLMLSNPPPMIPDELLSVNGSSAQVAGGRPKTSGEIAADNDAWFEFQHDEHDHREEHRRNAINKSKKQAEIDAAGDEVSSSPPSVASSSPPVVSSIADGLLDALLSHSASGSTTSTMANTFPHDDIVTTVQTSQQVTPINTLASGVTTPAAATSTSPSAAASSSAPPAQSMDAVAPAASTDLPTLTPATPVTSFSLYKEWSLVTLTKNYMLVILAHIADDAPNTGVLVHCIRSAKTKGNTARREMSLLLFPFDLQIDIIFCFSPCSLCVSGWDRTPLFVSLIRLSLWADGLVHRTLNAMQILYFTIAYDWCLFGHQRQTTNTHTQVKRSGDSG